MKDNISKAQKKYRDSKTYQVNLRFLLDKDKDVIAELKKQDNKPAYFRKLIRDSIKRRKKGNRLANRKEEAKQ